MFARHAGIAYLTFKNYFYMRTFNYIVAIFLAAVVSIQASAQDTIYDRNVTVEREYKPVIQDAGKINSTPEIIEPVVEKTPTTYTEFNLPLNADFNIHTLPAAELKHERRLETKTGFARFGLGSNYNTLADFALPVVKTSDMRLDFTLNHYATFSSKTHSKTNAALAFDKYFKKFDLYAGLGGGHEYLKYYGSNFNRAGAIGLDTLAGKYGDALYREVDLSLVHRTPRTLSLNDLANDSTGQTFWRFNTYAGIRSLPLSTGLRYMAETQYKVVDSHYGLTEHLLQTVAGFNALRDKNRMGLDMQLYNLAYRSEVPSLLNFWSSYSVFSMNPYYSFERTAWDLRLGVKSSFSFVHGRPFNPSPDVSFEWRAIPPYFAIYGGITGDYQVNTMNSMFAENRYLFPDIRVKDTYTPVEFYGGVKIKPLHNLLFDGYVDYRRIDNQYFFVNKEYSLAPLTGGIDADNHALYTNRFNVVYSDASLLKVGGRANYNWLNRVNVQLKGSYNRWNVADEQYAWNKPKWEGDLGANVRLDRNISVDGNIFVQGKRYAKLGDTAMPMSPKVDVNLGISYSYNNWFTAFGRINNLINNQYQDYYGYDVQGFNVMAGAAFSF